MIEDISPNERAYTQAECQQKIKDALNNMKKNGYYFLYSTKQPLPGYVKEMCRNKIYLRFNCSNCQDIRNRRKQKRFTSTLGTTSIQFQFYQEEDQQTLLVFQFRIYRMRCLRCGKWGEPEIYDSQLEKIEYQFCKIVADILDERPPPQPNRNKDPIKVPDLRDHKHSECQACRLQKCHKPEPCPEEDNIQHQKQSLSSLKEFQQHAKRP